MTSAAPGRSSGFSLIEVLIAMFILSIGAASVLSFYAAAASTHFGCVIEVTYLKQ